jgi:hypothetical protein
MRKSTLILTAVALAGSFQFAFAGDVTGKVTLKGTPPPEKAITFDDRCGPMNPAVKTTRHYVVGKDGGLANVFVYISKGMEGKKFPVPSAAVEINQEGCNYHPYVSGVMVGQTLKIKNSDAILHNVHALPKIDGNTEFNFAQPEPGMVNDDTWTKKVTSKEVMLKLKCDVHPWMFAYVGVMDHPFFAVTDGDGNFKIPNVPAGEHTLTAYHLKAHGATPGVSQTIKVAGDAVTANFDVEVKPAQ